MAIMVEKKWPIEKVQQQSTKHNLAVYCWSNNTLKIYHPMHLVQVLSFPPILQ